MNQITMHIEVYYINTYFDTRSTIHEETLQVPDSLSDEQLERIAEEIRDQVDSLAYVYFDTD
jgi:hypothetical protein